MKRKKSSSTKNTHTKPETITMFLEFQDMLHFLKFKRHTENWLWNIIQSKILKMKRLWKSLLRSMRLIIHFQNKKWELLTMISPSKPFIHLVLMRFFNNFFLKNHSELLRKKISLGHWFRIVWLRSWTSWWMKKVIGRLMKALKPEEYIKSIQTKMGLRAKRFWRR